MRKKPSQNNQSSKHLKHLLRGKSHRVDQQKIPLMLKKVLMTKAQTKKAKKPLAQESGMSTATSATTEAMLFAVMDAPMWPIFRA